MNRALPRIRLSIIVLFFLVPLASFAATSTTDIMPEPAAPLVTACPVITASTIDITPKVGTYVVGDDIVLRVVVTSAECPLIGVEASIEYDPKEVTVTSVSREGSLLTSWTQEPSINEEIGEILFGGTLATSTPLTDGLMLTIHARPLRVGEMRMSFKNESAIHEGSGGNILTGFTSGKYRINPKELGDLSVVSVPASEEVVAGEVLGAATSAPAVIVSSPTHPNQSAWYNASSSSFLFQFDGEITSLRLGFDQKLNGRARIAYTPIVNTKEIVDLENGVWFLHVSAVLAEGETYETSYQIQTDRTLPENFTAKEVVRSDNSDPNITIMVNATDTISGIDHYEFALDGGVSERWESLSDGEFHHNVVSPGTHELTALVYDKAGNMLSQKLSFEVISLSSPRLSLKDPNVQEGEVLALSIESLPGATVDISISRNGDSPTIEHTVMDATGKGEFESALTLSPGSYSVVAIATDARGATSKESERIGVTVSSSLWGLMSRHPLIPIGILGLIFIAALGFFMFRKMRADDGREFIDDEEPVTSYESTPTAREISERQEVSSSRGQVVLQPRSRNIEVHAPPTRL